MNKQQEPRLRFKGFTGAWEEKTLNDVSEVFEYGLNAQAVNFDGVHKYIRITDIDDESRQFLQENVTSPDVDFSKADNYKLQKGDLLFARTGASVGKSYLYNENDGLVYFAGFLIRAKLKKEFDAQFIFQNTLTNHFNRFVTLTSQRSGQPGINSKEYSKFEFLAPSLPEQTHLGLFFRRLDNQIAESRAVLEKSRQLKKAMLAKMFPANGEKIPKIRFKGFEGEWESRKLGDVVEIVMGQSPSSTSYTDNPSDFILVQGNADMKNGKVCPRVWTTECIKLGAAGDIVMSVRAPVGDVGKTDYDIVVGRGVCAIKGNEFIYQTLWKMKLDGYWNSLSSGSTFESINSNDVKNSEILIPIQEEQTAIGNFFRQLDETIALQSAEVEKLNQLKKGLLAAMLV
ncbi:MAG: restriction endonuclease subunit S [Neisseria meningitidis]|nr:restriction endonuclease subunit S [Neisseria meningitidis]